MSIKPNIQGIVLAGQPFIVRFDGSPGDRGEATVTVDEPRELRFFPQQAKRLKQRVFLLGSSRSSSVIDWGTSADKGSTVTVEIDGNTDRHSIG